MQHRFLELDVFATTAFTGNPLAVIAGADTLSTEDMQRIAAWTNFSETTFLLAPTDPQADYRVRIFTPVEEFDFAGHPTLGTAYAWLELGNTPRNPGVVMQECGAGLVHVQLDDEHLAFATPPLKRTGDLEPEELERIRTEFSLKPEQILDSTWGDNGPGWMLVHLDSLETLRSLAPSAARTLKVAFVALTPGDDTTYEIRAFTPTFEDPVTGSAHGAIAEWMRTRTLVPATYTARQGHNVGRAGVVSIYDDGTDIWVGGEVHTRVAGTLTSS